MGENFYFYKSLLKPNGLNKIFNNIIDKIIKL